jgi:hypothetical protein
VDGVAHQRRVRGVCKGLLRPGVLPVLEDGPEEPMPPGLGCTGPESASAAGWKCRVKLRSERVSAAE